MPEKSNSVAFSATALKQQNVYSYGLLSAPSETRVHTMLGLNVIKGAALLASLTLMGCVPGHRWQNPSLRPETTSRQLQIDSAECTAIAMQSIQLPSQTAFPSTPDFQSPRSYSISGTATTYGPNGNSQTSVYSGQAYANSGGVYLSPTTAFAQGQAAAQISQDNWQHNRVYAARDQLMAACMMRRGWQRAASN